MAEEAPAPLCALTISAPAASTRAANRGSTEWTLPETLPFAAPEGTIQVVGSRNAAPLPPSASTVAIRLTGAKSSPASYSTANVSRPPSSSSDAAAYESGYDTCMENSPLLSASAAAVNTSSHRLPAGVV